MMIRRLTYFLLLLLLVGCHKKENKHEMENAAEVKTETEVETMTLHRSPFQMQLICNGKLAAVSKSEISFQGQGVVTKIYVHDGSRVAKGTLLATIDKSDYVVLLDEHGKEYTSMDFSRYIEKKMSTVSRRLVFVVGGPYGFSDDVYARANEKISLSKMTFSHEMIRLIFTEQLYRAMTILNGEPYHHE